MPPDSRRSGNDWPMRTITRELSDGWTVRQLDPPANRYSDAGVKVAAHVPGHIHLDLQRAGVIPDPFERMHERTVAWVDDVDWLYECTFTVSDAEASEGARRFLRFDGLDTIAVVRLDGEVIGSFDNMHIAYEIDVSDRLAAGEHALEVEFRSAERVGSERRSAALAANPDLHAFRRGLSPRTMVRKAQYHFGWDWGPVLRGCGIWRPVSLVVVPRGRIVDWSHGVAFDDAAGTASITVSATSDGHASELQVTIGDVSASAAVVAGSASVVVTIEDAQRWWPNGYGEPKLYDLEIELRDGDDVVDARRARIGLRTIDLITDPDEVGATFHFRVNGVAVYAKGANWIPDDSFPARTTRERVHGLITMARDCGMNMLRIWGGGLYESEDFYETCDELGILVWQDFAYACAFYLEDDEAAGVADSEARAAITRLRHHPSLALWCGNNENQWLGLMGAWGRVERVLGDRLYDEVLPNAVADLDPTRPYWPGSPFGGSEPNSHDSGDCHDWNVWHGKGDWRHYEECTARFVSEFGFSAPPALATLREFLADDDLGVDTPAMRWHDKTAKGYETYLGYIALHYPEPATVDDLVYYGQCNQADAMRFGIEHFRRLRPHNMGTLAWQLNDCWPVQSWAWIDYRLRPKAVWYAAKRFYAPLLVSLWHADGSARVHLVNDRRDAVAGSVVLRAVDARGVERWRHERDAAVDALAGALVVDAALPDDVTADATSVVLHATFAGTTATALLCEPRDLALPAPTVQITGADRGGGVTALTVEVDTTVVALELSLDGLDATWSDNFLTLVPGERAVLDVEPHDARLTADEVTRRLRWRTMRHTSASATSRIKGGV